MYGTAIYFLRYVLALAYVLWSTDSNPIASYRCCLQIFQTIRLVRCSSDSPLRPPQIVINYLKLVLIHSHQHWLTVWPCQNAWAPRMFETYFPASEGRTYSLSVLLWAALQSHCQDKYNIRKSIASYPAYGSYI